MGIDDDDWTQVAQHDIEKSVEQLLEALDLDWEDDPHFRETPRRVAKMLLSFRQEQSLRAILETGWEHSSDDLMVVQTLIPFRGLCAHHLLPFWGTAAVGYIPHGRIVGLSKLTRLVAAAGTQQPTTQEAITQEVADTLMDVLKPDGVGVLTTALHGCMAVRGVLAPSTSTTASVMRGSLLTETAARNEFLALTRQ